MYNKKKIKEIDSDYLQKIEYIEANASYSILKPTNEVFCKPLKYFDLLLQNSWIRANRSILINPNFVEKKMKLQNKIVINNGIEFEVSRRKAKACFLPLKK